MTKHNVASLGDFKILERIVEEEPNYGRYKTYYIQLAGGFPTLERASEYIREHPDIVSGDDRYIMVCKQEKVIRTDG